MTQYGWLSTCACLCLYVACSVCVANLRIHPPGIFATATFVSQSLGDNEEKKPETSDSKDVRVKRAYFRIGDSPTRVGSDSPVADMLNPKKTGMREFSYKGKLIETDGKRSTKLTKLFKRRDNQGKLLDSIKEMKLDE